jgi:insertion element IS1 protein InsB
MRLELIEGKLSRSVPRGLGGSNPTWLLDAYERHLDPDMHSPGKRNTQKIERKHLTLRTRIKRLVRKTIGFSKSIQMHDIVIGWFVNRYAFGLRV